MVERRRGLVGPGLTDPGLVFPEVGQARVVRELQEQIEALYRKLSEMEAASDARVEWRPAAVEIREEAAKKRAPGVELSDEPPESVAKDHATATSADAGTSEKAARADHVHVGNQSNILPAPVGAVAHAGNMATVSRRDHVHAGVMYHGVVEELPAIPAAGVVVVIWSRDGQAWWTCAGQTSWEPCLMLSTLSGVPL